MLLLFLLDEHVGLCLEGDNDLIGESNFFFVLSLLRSFDGLILLMLLGVEVSILLVGCLCDAKRLIMVNDMN